MNALDVYAAQFDTRKPNLGLSPDLVSASEPEPKEEDRPSLEERVMAMYPSAGKAYDAGQPTPEEALTRKIISHQRDAALLPLQQAEEQQAAINTSEVEAERTP